MIATIIGFITKAVTLLFGTIFRGIASILVMALAGFLWKRVSAWKGTFPARPFTILFFPIVTVVLLAVYLVFFVLRITLWAFPAALLAILLGLVLGWYSGTTTHLYNTRWNRIMITARGRLLTAWFGAMVLAAFFRILPFGWLSTPTMALFLALSLAVILAHLILYLRWKELQVTGHRKVDGPRLELALAPDEAAVFAAFLDLYGPRRTPIPQTAIAAALRAGERPRQDLAFGLLPEVKAAWTSLAAAPEKAAAVIERLVASGILAPGITPGPMTARLLEIGSISRTVTLGAARFDPDGRTTVAETAHVIVQAGGVNLLFGLDGGTVRLHEMNGAEIFGLMKDAFLTPAHRELLR